MAFIVADAFSAEVFADSTVETVEFNALATVGSAAGLAAIKIFAAVTSSLTLSTIVVRLSTDIWDRLAPTGASVTLAASSVILALILVCRI